MVIILNLKVWVSIKDLKPGDKVNITFEGKYAIEHYSNAPGGFFLGNKE